jgi:hypothetical protein
MSSGTVTAKPPRPALLPGIIFVGLTLLALAFVVRNDAILTKLGLDTHSGWFLDSYALLADNDAVTAGLDISNANPYDRLQRPQVYSDWWLGLRHLNLHRSDNFLLGCAFVISFLATAFLAIRPRKMSEALVWPLLFVAPPVLLGLQRGNNDLAVFTLVALAAWLAPGPAAWRRLGAVALIAAATGLKYYPFFAVAGFLLIRPARSTAPWFGLATCAAGLALASVWPDMRRADFQIPNDVHHLGAEILLRDLDCNGRWARILGAAIVLGAGAWLWRSGRTRVAEPATDRGGELIAFAMGAAILLSCFLARANHGYRWIYVVLLLPWLWRGRPTEPRAQRIWRLTRILAMTVPWLDGIYCIVLNTLFGPLPPDVVMRWTHYWRLVTQPLQWILMMLLAGWLWDIFARAWSGVVRENLPESGRFLPARADNRHGQ